MVQPSPPAIKRRIQIEVGKLVYLHMYDGHAKLISGWNFQKALDATWHHVTTPYNWIPFSKAV